MKGLKNTITSWLLAIVVLLSAGCSKDVVDNQTESGDGQGDATLTLTIGKSETRSAKDGDLMNNLTVLLVSSTSNIVGRSITTPNAATATVSFSRIVRGDYTLYIVANAPSNIDLSTSAYAVGATLPTTLVNQLLPSLTGTDTPVYTDQQGMPLSLIKKIALGPGANAVSAVLERVTGRLRITVFNHIPSKKLCISRGSLSNFNANTGYLFSHNYTPPTSVSYRAFASSSQIWSIESYTNTDVLDKYVYENQASSYEVHLEGAIFNVSDQPASYTSTVTIGNNISSNTQITAGNSYFIRSYSDQNYYLYMTDEGTLGARYFASDAALLAAADYRNFLWKFSGTSSGTLQNVQTERYLAFDDDYYQWTSQTTDDSYASLYFGTSKAVYIRYGSSGYRYFVRRNETSITEGGRYNNNPTNDNDRWYLRAFNLDMGWKDANGNVVNPIKKFVAVQPINYINSFGASAVLDQIKRNENLHMIVNVYYSESANLLDFEVESWLEKSAETTFD